MIERPWQVKEIATDSISSLVFHKYDDLFGLHVFVREGDYCLGFLTHDKKEIKILNLDKNYVTNSINVESSLSLNGFYTSIFIEDTLFFVNATNRIYYKYLSIKGALKLLDTLDIGQILNCKKCLPYSDYSKQALIYHYPYLLVHYGHATKKNFIDSKAYLSLNLKNKTVKKIVDYPNCYNCSFVYDAGVNAIFNKEGSIISLFNQYDKFYQLKPDETQSHSVELLHDCKFKSFDESKEMNIAYVKKYFNNGERNVNLLNVQDKYFIVNKQLFKSNLNIKSQFSFFVFDSTFRQVYSEITEHPVFPPAIFNYKNGFIMFNDSLNKAWYYDFKK